MNASIEMPCYQSHKKVHALKIKHISGKLMLFDDERYMPITASNSLFVRYTPVPGDYYIVYDDGYESISPAKVFEDGYTLIS